MTVTPQERLSRRGELAPPVRLVHLGLGNFFRSHQAWYTAHASDGGQWGVAAFSGRDGSTLVQRLSAQDGLYTLIVREPTVDRFEVIDAVAEVHAAKDREAWLGYFRAPTLAAVTITVTEAGYLRRDDGALDLDNRAVRSDIERLRNGDAGSVVSVPALLVAALAARRETDAGPIALVSCDNVAANGAMTARIVLELASEVSTSLSTWISESVAFVTSVVDRITPRTEPEHVQAVARASRFADRCPVVTEPFHEWVLSGAFPAGRPAWENAGAIVADDPTPYSHRKLWLLNGAHSLLAYAGSILGHATVDEAIDDDRCRAWVEQWWAEAASRVGQEESETLAYRAALLDRFANGRIRHRLEQIAADGSQKLPMRVLPVLTLERAAGRLPEGALRILASWICHLRGLGCRVNDVRASELLSVVRSSLSHGVRAVLGMLDAALADDEAVVVAVTDLCHELERPQHAQAMPPQGLS